MPTFRNHRTISKLMSGLALSLVLSVSTISADEAPPQFCGGLTPTIIGTEGDDVISGTEGPDVILALGGNDTIYPKGGADILCGGLGDDSVYGADGNDVLYGDGGNDLLNGGNGDDTLNGGDGQDSLYGSNGNDLLNGGDGDDVLNSGAGDNVLNGEAGNDTLNGGNWIDILNGGAGDDILNGGDGDDTLTDDSGINRLNGGNGNDTLLGGSGQDTLTGGNGNDFLKAFAGDDLLNAGDGDDRLLGGEGRDTLNGGEGKDFMNGGPDPDTLIGGPGQDTIDWYYPNDTINNLTSEDRLTLNGLKLTHSGGFAVIIPVYGDFHLSQARTLLKPQLRSDDIILLSSGNFDGSIDIPWINQASRAVRAEFPQNPIAVLTSGRANISQAAEEITGPVDILLYGYEPNMSNEPDFSWDFAVTLNTFEEIATEVRAKGFELYGYPTGRPLLQRNLWQYGWQYGSLSAQIDGLMVQTQTYCESDVTRYQEALDRLEQQHQGASSAQPWYTQVTIALDLTNTTTLAEAEACSKTARDAGVPGVMVWGSPARPQDMMELLAVLGR